MGRYLPLKWPPEAYLTIYYVGTTRSTFPFEFAGSGLQMTFNVETYEQMWGPDPTMAMKVLIYEQNGLPMVKRRALNVPIGYRSYIGMKFQKV